jgi:cobalamin biosynthesis protein CobT
MGLYEDLSKFNRRQEAVVTAFSKIGYKVVPRKGGPCIDREHKVVYMPIVDPAEYPDVIRTIRGWTDHEMAHELYESSREDLKKAISKGKKFESIFRYLDDGRVERLESRDFEGCRENLVYLEKETLADRKKMGLTLYLACKYGVEGVKLYKMDEWGSILGTDLIKKCHNIKDSGDIYDVAQECYKRIQKYIEDAVDSEMESSEEDTEESEQHPTVGKDGPEKEKKEKGTPKEPDELLQDEKEKPKPKKDKKSKEEKDDSSKEDSNDTSGDTSEDTSEGDKGNKEEPEESNDNKEDPTKESEDESKSESDEVNKDKEGEGEKSEDSTGDASEDVENDTDEEEGSSEDRKSRIKSKLDSMISDKDLMDGLLDKLHKELDKIPETPGTYTPYTVNDKVYDLTKSCDGFYSKHWFPGLINEARTKVSALAQKLRLELFATKMMFERYKDRGRLDQRRLHVLGMGTTADVFMRRIEQPEMDTAISLLIDASASMECGNKIRLAAQVAYLLSSTLETLNIPNEVLSFTARTRYGIRPSGYDRTIPLEHYIHKSFTSRLNHCMEAMNRIGSFMCENTDGESVLWAAARLATRKEKRRILFVLSDGNPQNGDTDSDKLDAHLKEVVKMVSKHGIECVGIGILTDCVKEYYPHNVVVNNINDLVSTAYGEIVKAIRGARREV